MSNQRRPPPSRSGYSDGESAAQWEADWRKDISTQLKAATEANASVAIILERVTVKLNDHDRRIEALEAQPATNRANTYSDRTQSIMLTSLAISLLALLVSVLHGGPITIP